MLCPLNLWKQQVDWEMRCTSLSLCLSSVDDKQKAVKKRVDEFNSLFNCH
ncbi:hypothetical protein [Brunnivagina elsteri]|nr:hypothetical protein [Calothrix elsteri]